jgi:hypothetical protein
MLLNTLLEEPSPKVKRLSIKPQRSKDLLLKRESEERQSTSNPRRTTLRLEEKLMSLMKNSSLNILRLSKLLRRLNTTPSLMLKSPPKPPKLPQLSD